MNPENKCSHLWTQPVDKLPTIDEMFAMQKSLQDHLNHKGKGINIDNAQFFEKVNQITKEWRNISLEFAELLERLPFKEWKTYTPEQLKGFESDEHRLEVWYEFIDIFHFYMNIGLLLGIDGPTFQKLYATKNKENFDRQKRGY